MAEQGIADLQRQAPIHRTVAPSTAPVSGNVRLVYMAAMHNSGSTVISLAANVHPELVSPGEMVGPGGRHHGPEGPTCSCGEIVAKCPFWGEISRRYMAQGHPWQPAHWGLDFAFDNSPLLTRLVYRRPNPAGTRMALFRNVPGIGGHVRMMKRRNACYAKLIVDVSGKPVVLDASKYPERIVHLRRTPGIDLSIIHLLRDPRGWCNSRKRRDHGDVSKTAAEWVQRNEYLADLAGGGRTATVRERQICMRYEDFCSDPAGEMNRIFALAGLPDHPFPDDLREVQHHLLGNQMRNRGDKGVKQDLAWQTELTADEIATIESITRPAARRFGYQF